MALWARIKKHRINSHLIIDCPTSERTSERTAQYFSLYSWLFWPIVNGFRLTTHLEDISESVVAAFISPSFELMSAADGKKSAKTFAPTL